VKGRDGDPTRSVVFEVSPTRNTGPLYAESVLSTDEILGGLR
jgi:hypothetical protein